LPASNTVSVLYDDVNKTLYEEYKYDLNELDKQKIRDYLYEKMRYHLMKDPGRTVHNFDLNDKSRDSLLNILGIKDEKKQHDEIDPVFVKNMEESHDVILENNLDKTLKIPLKYRKYMIERLVYELKYLKLKKDEILNEKNILPSIPDMLLFKKEPNETFKIYQIVTTEDPMISED